jgi:hypothetical protein
VSAAASAVGREDMLLDNDDAFGRLKLVNWESWLENEMRDREYIELVRDDL